MSGLNTEAMSPEELTNKWSHVLNDPWVKEVPTWTEPHNLAYLCELASKSKFMVELGTYMGASALVMLRANPTLHLWTVDHFQAFFGNLKIAEHFLAKEIADHRCEIIVGDSKRAAEMLSHMKGSIDGAFCDDGHEEWQVLQDIQSIVPLLSGVGIMAGHDFDETNDVARGVKASGYVYSVPVPRMWVIQNPQKRGKCCGR